MGYKSRKKRIVLGLGFDGDDDHLRVTRGENFYLLGGSQSTHDAMRGKVVCLNKIVKCHGKHLDDVSDKEMDDIAHSIGLRYFKHVIKNEYTS